MIYYALSLIDITNKYGSEVTERSLEIVKSSNKDLIKESGSISSALEEVVGSVGKGSNFVKQSKKQLIKSKISHELLIREHEQKLANYITNPDKYDNLGLLKNISQEIRQKRIQGRIEALEKQIRRQREDLDIINILLKSKE